MIDPLDPIINLDDAELADPSPASMAAWNMVVRPWRAPARLKSKPPVLDNTTNYRECLYLDTGGEEDFLYHLYDTLAYDVPTAVGRAKYPRQEYGLPWVQFGPDGIWMKEQSSQVKSTCQYGHHFNHGTFLWIAWWSQFPGQIHVRILAGLCIGAQDKTQTNLDRHAAWGNVYPLRLNRWVYITEMRDMRDTQAVNNNHA